jgi:hypothetical protein
MNIVFQTPTEWSNEKDSSTIILELEIPINLESENKKEG